MDLICYASLHVLCVYTVHLNTKLQVVVKIVLHIRISRNPVSALQ